METVHRFWTSMSAIFGFTFHIGRMTEVLTPGIYIELTVPIFYTLFRSSRHHLAKWVKNNSENNGIL